MSEENQRLKSPPYPSMDLERAIERAEQLRDVARGFAVPLPSAAKSWGYSPTSSSIASVVGALNQFGLIEEAGGGEGRRVKISPLGEAIILDKRPASPNRASAVTTAALSPKVFKELWEQYKTWDVDQDTIKYELTLGRKHSGKAPYSESAALDVAKNYRASLKYAKISDKIEDAPMASATDQGNTPEGTPESLGMAPQISDSNTGQNSTYRSDPVPHILSEQNFEERKSLDEGSAILIWPRDLSYDSVEDMEYWLTGVLKQVKRRAKQSQNE